MSADTKNEPSPNDTKQSGNSDQKPDKLAEVQAQLAALIEQQNALTQTVATAMRPAKKVEEESDDNLYDPKKLRNKIISESQEMFQQQLRDEKAKDAMIWELSQEYPEIKSDQKIRNDILAAQKTLPEAIRDTAQGYEIAVLRATSKAGLVAKSKRQVVDEDAAVPSRSSGESRPKGKVKLAAETLATAELMGMDINNPDVIKRLEAAASRDRYDKYR